MHNWGKQKQPNTLTDIQRAARFYDLHTVAFGAKVGGQNYGAETSEWLHKWLPLQRGVNL